MSVFIKNEVRKIKKPLYLQLSEILIDKIINEMKVDDLLPSERNLADIYGVSRTTVRLSLDDLEKKGYVLRKHGIGSYVIDRHNKLINLGDMYSFTDQMKAMGKIPQTNLIDRLTIPIPKNLEEIFPKSEKKLIKLIRVRLADQTPLIYEESYLPYQKFQTIFDKNLHNRPLYDIFFEDYHEIINFAQEDFSADLATKDVAKHLTIDENSAVLKIYRTTYNSNNEVIEYTNSMARPDKFTYRTIHYNRLD